MCVRGRRDVSVDSDRRHYLRGHLSALQEHQITITINCRSIAPAAEPTDRAASVLQVTEVKTRQHRHPVCKLGRNTTFQYAHFTRCQRNIMKSNHRQLSTKSKQKPQTDVIMSLSQQQSGTNRFLFLLIKNVWKIFGLCSVGLPGKMIFIIDYLTINRLVH